MKSGFFFFFPIPFSFARSVQQGTTATSLLQAAMQAAARHVHQAHRFLAANRAELLYSSLQRFSVAPLR